jgi:hypothetical protein
VKRKAPEFSGAFFVLIKSGAKAEIEQKSLFASILYFVN